MNKKIISIFLIACVLIMAIIPTCFADGLTGNIKKTQISDDVVLVRDNNKVIGIISVLLIMGIFFIETPITFILAIVFGYKYYKAEQNSKKIALKRLLKTIIICCSIILGSFLLVGILEIIKGFALFD